MAEQRELDIEGHIIVDNNIADKQQWSKSKTEPSPSKHLTDSNLEAVRELLFPEVIEESNNLKEENRQLKEENWQQKEQLENQTDENTRLRRVVSDQALLLQEYKDKLEKLQRAFDENNQGGMMVSTDGLKFVYNVTHFNEYIKIDQIDFMFLQMQKLVEIKIEPDKYLLDNAAAVVPVYIVLSKRFTMSSTTPYIYSYGGSMRDFCNEWNSNVVAYIKDEERAKALTCVYESFKREHSKAPWSQTSPTTWRRDIINSRNKTKLDRAINIKMYIDRLLPVKITSC